MYIVVTYLWKLISVREQKEANIVKSNGKNIAGNIEEEERYYQKQLCGQKMQSNCKAKEKEEKTYKNYNKK